MQALLRKAGPLDDEAGLHLFAINVMLLKALGPDYLTWDFTALKEEVTERWGEPGPVAWQKVMAGVLLQSTSIFWKEWEVFENITAAINGEYPIFTYMQPPEPEEVAIALVTAARVDRNGYAPEVLRYIVAACLDDGMWYFDGTPLAICQDVLQEYDRRLGIERRYGDVASALIKHEGFFDDPQTAAEVQANKVREVQLVLSRYTKQLDSQLKGIAG